MIDFEPDPVEEADREAQLLNEKNHIKKRRINGYNFEEQEKDQQALDNDYYKFNTQIDKDHCQAKIHGEFDNGIYPPDSN